MNRRDHHLPAGSANVSDALQQSDKDMMLEVLFGSAAPYAGKAVGMVASPVGKQVAGAVGFVAAVGLIAHVGKKISG